MVWAQPGAVQAACPWLWRMRSLLFQSGSRDVTCFVQIPYLGATTCFRLSKKLLLTSVTSSILEMTFVKDGKGTSEFALTQTIPSNVNLISLLIN